MLVSTFTVVSLGTVTMKSTVLTLLLKFMDLGISYLRVMLFPACSIVYLMVFTSCVCTGLGGVVGSLDYLDLHSVHIGACDGNTACIVSYFQSDGFFASTLRVLLSSNTEGIFRLSNGLLVAKLLAKKITDTNANANQYKCYN